MTRRPVLLMVMNPRRIGAAIESIAELDVHKVWLSRFSEYGLRDVIADVIETTGYRHYMIVSDDGIVTQDAVDRVLELAGRWPVVTGYCNLDESGDGRVNLTKRPLVGDTPTAEAYGELWTRDEVETYPVAPVPTGFTGLSLTTMGRELWQRFPFEAIGGPDPAPSFCSDFRLSVRLRDAGVPIVAARGAFTRHLKAAVNETDRTAGRELLVGVEPPAVTFGDVPEPAAVPA